MGQKIRLQGDSNAHDRPWKVAVEQGFFADEGLTVEYQEDNPKGVAGRVEDFSQRWKESQLQQGALGSLSGMRMGRDRARAGAGQGQDHRARHHDPHRRDHGARGFENSERGGTAQYPVAVTWHAGTFYAAIEVLEAAGVPFAEIKLVHANDRLDALLSGETEAAALMEPLVSRAAEAGARKIADLRWRGGIVAGGDVDEETAAKLRRALNRAIEWLRETTTARARSCCAISSPSSAPAAFCRNWSACRAIKPAEFQEKVDWMLDRGFLKEAPAYEDVVRSK